MSGPTQHEEDSFTVAGVKDMIRILGTEQQPAPVANASASVWQLVIADMKEREQFGIRKYGTPVQANNGRDALLDAYQEALDLCVYLRQAIAERQVARTVRETLGEDVELPKNVIIAPPTKTEERQAEERDALITRHSAIVKDVLMQLNRLRSENPLAAFRVSHAPDLAVEMKQPYQGGMYGSYNLAQRILDNEGVLKVVEDTALAPGKVRVEVA